jgi:hypothetical protein
MQLKSFDLAKQVSKRLATPLDKSVCLNNTLISVPKVRIYIVVHIITPRSSPSIEKSSFYSYACIETVKTSAAGFMKTVFILFVNDSIFVSINKNSIKWFRISIYACSYTKNELGAYPTW